MHNLPVTVAFHTVDEKHEIVPLILNDNFQLSDPFFKEEWEDDIEKLVPLCKAAGLGIAQQYNQELEQYWIHILLIQEEHLCQPEFFNNIPGGTLRPLARSKVMPQHGRYDPIITIAPPDFLDLNTQPLPEEMKDGRKRLLHEKEKGIDTRAKFLDSSIWHRYVPEQPAAEHNCTFAAYFSEVLEEIIDYWKDGLYFTISAVTTLEFQLRMLRHSYIGSFGLKGHAGVVTPFKFHSERHLKYRSELREQENFLTKKRTPESKSLLEALEWRMLLVDDYGEMKLSTIDAKYDEFTVQKHVLVRRPLDKLYERFNVDALKQFELVSPQEKTGIIQFAIDELSDRSFDIIFLDYLLGERAAAGLEKPESREYGHEFLLHLIEDSRSGNAAYHRDFFGRFWIFPVSSFPFALADKLAQLGVGHLHSIWHLSGGGDPVTTPHLYGFYLYRFLKQKIAEYYLYPKALQRLLNEIPNFEYSSNGVMNWARCIEAALSHYVSRLEVVKNSRKDNTQSPFLETMDYFLDDEGIEDMLKEIIDNINPAKFEGVPIDDCIELVKRVENFIKVNHPEYKDISLSAFLESVKVETEKRAQEKIEDARRAGKSVLDLSYGYLSAVPEDVRGLNINTLDLSRNMLKRIPVALKDLRRLEILNLSDNKLEDLTDMPLALSELRQLHSINLNNNPITNGLPAQLRDIKNNKDLVQQLLKYVAEHTIEPSCFDESKVEFSKTIRQQLSEGKEDDAFRLLEKAEKEEYIPPHLSNEVVMYLNDYNAYREEKRKGVLTKLELEQQRRKLVDSVLNFLRVLKSEVN